MRINIRSLAFWVALLLLVIAGTSSGLWQESWSRAQEKVYGVSVRGHVEDFPLDQHAKQKIFLTYAGTLQIFLVPPGKVLEGRVSFEFSPTAGGEVFRKSFGKREVFDSWKSRTETDHPGAASFELVLPRSVAEGALSVFVNEEQVGVFECTVDTSKPRTFEAALLGFTLTSVQEVETFLDNLDREIDPNRIVPLMENLKRVAYCVLLTDRIAAVRKSAATIPYSGPPGDDDIRAGIKDGTVAVSLAKFLKLSRGASLGAAYEVLLRRYCDEKGLVSSARLYDDLERCLEPIEEKKTTPTSGVK